MADSISKYLYKTSTYQTIISLGNIFIVLQGAKVHKFFKYETLKVYCVMSVASVQVKVEQMKMLKLARLGYSRGLRRGLYKVHYRYADILLVGLTQSRLSDNGCNRHPYAHDRGTQTPIVRADACGISENA